MTKPTRGRSKKASFKFHGFKVSRVSKPAGVLLGFTLADLVACDPGMRFVSRIDRPVPPRSPNESSEWRLPISRSGKVGTSPRSKSRTRPVFTRSRPRRVGHFSRNLSQPPIRAASLSCDVTRGGTETLNVRFDLAEPVYKAFKQSAEFGLHYVSGKGISSTTIVASSLN